MLDKPFAAYNKPLLEQIEALKHVIQLNHLLVTVIHTLPRLDIQDYYKSVLPLTYGSKDLDLVYYAPFGLNDLFGMMVRANKVQITEEIYNKKVERWKVLWPGLTIIPWSGGSCAAF